MLKSGKSNNESEFRDFIFEICIKVYHEIIRMKGYTSYNNSCQLILYFGESVTYCLYSDK